jgi:hypothetical protein
MTQKEEVTLLRKSFRGMNAPLRSKINKPDVYGIALTAKAKGILRAAEGRVDEKRTLPSRLTVRFTESEMERLQLAQTRRHAPSLQAVARAAVLEWLTREERYGYIESL